MKWIDKINEWSNGKVLKYPKKIKSRFFYETSVCDKNMKNEYKEKFIKNNLLDTLTEDFSSFEKHLKNMNNQYILSFPNKSGDCMLIVPIPEPCCKNFTTIKDFIDNASEGHQILFWKKVAQEVKKILKTHDKIYISTHGLGVPYFHLRLDIYPKYYHTKNFI